MSDDVPNAARPNHLWRWLIIAAVVVALAVGGFIYLNSVGRGGPQGSPGAGSTSSPQATATGATPVPSPSLPSATASGTPTVETARPKPSVTASIDQPADIVTGVSARVTKIEAVSGVANGPGEIAGPALRITVEVTNSAEAPFDLSAAIVNLYYGKARTPAGMLSGPGVQSFPASVSPGASATGRFVFNVPKASRGTIQVEFRGSPDASVAIFAGAA